MKLREVSDVHSEFFGEDEIARVAEHILPRLDSDPETILILAGDIGSAEKPECMDNFVGAVAPRFKHVLQIPGNHEYYFGNLQTTSAKLKNMLSTYKDVHYTDMGCGEIDGQHFVMATLWTDFDKNNPQSRLEAQMRMNDYRLIRNGEATMLPEDTYQIHQKTLAYFEEHMQEGDVVITHHSPSLRSIPAEYLTDRVNGAYHSDLEDLILRKKPRLWFHGHTHTAVTYRLGDTQVICNPRGYGNQFRKNGYKPEMVIEI